MPDLAQIDATLGWIYLLMKPLPTISSRRSPHHPSDDEDARIRDLLIALAR